MLHQLTQLRNILQQAYTTTSDVHRAALVENAIGRLEFIISEQRDVDAQGRYQALLG